MPPAEMAPDSPLLLGDDDLPAFDGFDAAQVSPALDRLLADAERAFAAAIADDGPATLDTLDALLEPPVERLHRAWNVVGNLQAVVDTPALRQAQADNLERVTDFFTRLGASPALYRRYRRFVADPGFAALPPSRRKALTDAVRDFELGGAALTGAARERHAQIQARLAALSQGFGDRVLDATDDWRLVVDESRLAGVPAHVVQAAREAAAADGAAGCQLTLQAPCRIPVLAQAHDRDLRETVWRATATRASEFGPAERDNGPLIAELLALRHEEATLLGLESHAHWSLATKMAATPQRVLDFLHDLSRRARTAAERELADLAAHARSRLGIADLQAWDRAYVSESLKRERHGVDGEALRPYLQLPRVLDGVLALAARLFDFELARIAAPTWHRDVQVFELTRGGARIGLLYLDLFARPGKQSGAWMDDARGRWRRPDGRLQTPIANLVCNFAPPSGGRPSLLSHDELLTLLHELGHGLHHLLTQVDERSIAGIAGVEWDAVELPSQFMENFGWQWPVLQSLTRHVDTGEPLPRGLFDRLLAARNDGAALALLRMVEFGLFDLHLHWPRHARSAGAAPDVMAVARASQAEAGAPPRHPDDRYPHNFTHLFDGGYAAGFYSYQWAEVLSSDAFAAFEESGDVLDAATATRYRREILEVGASRSAADSFSAFRGRGPTVDAFLRHQGLLPPGPAAATNRIPA